MIDQFKDYRESMGSFLDRQHALKIWGEEKISNYEDKFGELKEWEKNPLRQEKLRIAKDICEDLYFNPFVKLVGVSGSVAAGIMKDTDDIDLFVIVQDNFSWIYRMYAKLRLGSRVIWFGDTDKKNNICLNFISEERGLLLDNKDIFNMHEIYYLEPILGKEYYDKFLNCNSWLETDFFAEIPKYECPPRSILNRIISGLLFLPNLLIFLAQTVYMVILGHDPDLRRLMDSYRKGRIEFYRSNFRVEKLDEFYNKKDGNTTKQKSGRSS